MKNHDLIYELTKALTEIGEPVPIDWIATLATEGYDLSLILEPEKETTYGEDEDTSRKSNVG